MSDDPPASPASSLPTPDRDTSGKGVIEKAFGPAATEFGREVQPVGKEVGQVTAKAVRVGLRAIGGLIWGFEKIADYVEEKVAEKLRDVPEERIVSPDARIAAPAIQAMQYSSNEDEIREMFINLIASDMDKNTKNKVHPSFVEMIKQMNIADAKVLQAISKNDGGIILKQRLHLNKDKPQLYNEFDQIVAIPIAHMTIDAINKSISSLDRLGLIRVSETSYPAGRALEIVELYRKEKAYESFVENFKNVLTDGRRREEHLQGIWLTPLGRDFSSICITDRASPT